MTARRGKRLPEVPTGYEWLDLAWSQMVPVADVFVAIFRRRLTRDGRPNKGSDSSRSACSKDGLQRMNWKGLQRTLHCAASERDVSACWRSSSRDGP